MKTIITLPALPFNDATLEPYITKNTLGFHHGKHHKAYVDKANVLLPNSPFSEASIEDILKQTAGKAEFAGIFNNVAQAWNHSFYWNSIKPGGGGAPGGKIGQLILSTFGSFDKFKELFIENAVNQFGSGWGWLVQDSGALKLVKTGNADTPIAHGQKPLITVDVWEHAYYLDYQNRRPDYVKAFLENLANWDFAEKNLG